MQMGVPAAAPGADAELCARLDKAEADLALLHGRPFSERRYTALHARMTVAEADLARARELLTKARQYIKWSNTFMRDKSAGDCLIAEISAHIAKT
jgi:hypothetical protein